jgi:hypothetical protein
MGFNNTISQQQAALLSNGQPPEDNPKANPP